MNLLKNERVACKAKVDDKQGSDAAGCMRMGRFKVIPVKFRFRHGHKRFLSHVRVGQRATIGAKKEDSVFVKMQTIYIEHLVDKTGRLSAS